MEISERSSYETRLIDVIQRGGGAESVEALRCDFIVDKIREVRQSYDAVMAEYRLDGRDFLDLLRDEYGSGVVIDKVEDGQTRSYSVNDFYKISIGKFELMFEMNCRNGEECHTAELYYGKCYAFSAVFLTPERLLEIVDNVSEKYGVWQRQWNRILASAQKKAVIKQLSETAMVAYLRSRLKATGIEYNLRDKKESMEVFFKLDWGLKFKVNLTRTNFREQVDDAINIVLSLKNDMAKANLIGVHKSVSGSDFWTSEE